MFSLQRDINSLVLTLFVNICFLSMVTGFMGNLHFLWGTTPPSRTTKIPLYPVEQCQPTPPCDLSRCSITRDARNCPSLCDCRQDCPPTTCPNHCKAMSVSGFCPICQCPKTEEEACSGYVCPVGQSCTVDQVSCYQQSVCVPTCASPAPVVSSLMECHTTCPMFCAKLPVDESCSACLCWGLSTYPTWYLQWFQLILQDKVSIQMQTQYKDENELKQWFLLFISFLNLHKLEIESPEVFTTIFIKFVKFMKENNVDFTLSEMITLLFKKFYATLQAPAPAELEASTKLFLTTWFNKLVIILISSGDFGFTREDYDKWFEVFLRYIAERSALVRDDADLKKYLMLFSEHLKSDTDYSATERGRFLDITLSILMKIRTENQGHELIECQASCPFFCAKINLDDSCSACLCLGTTDYPSWYYQWYTLLLKDQAAILSQTNIVTTEKLKKWFLLFIYFRSMHNIDISDENALKEIFIKFVKYMKENNLDFSQMAVITALFKQFVASFQKDIQIAPEENTKIFLSHWFQLILPAFLSPGSLYTSAEGQQWFKAFLDFIAKQNVLIRDQNDLTKWLVLFVENLKTSSTLPQTERSYLLEITIIIQQQHKSITEDPNAANCHSQCPIGCVKIVVDPKCSYCLCLGADSPKWFILWYDILKEKMETRKINNFQNYDELKQWLALFVNFMNLHKIDIETEEEFVKIFIDFVNFIKSRGKNNFSIEGVRTLYIEFEEIVKTKFMVKKFIQMSKIKILETIKVKNPEISEQEVEVWFKTFLKFVYNMNISITSEEQFQSAIKIFIKTTPGLQGTIITTFFEPIILSHNNTGPTIYKIENEHEVDLSKLNGTIYGVNETKIIFNTTEVIYINGSPVKMQVNQQNQPGGSYGQQAILYGQFSGPQNSGIKGQTDQQSGAKLVPGHYSYSYSQVTGAQDSYIPGQADQHSVTYSQATGPLDAQFQLGIGN